MFFSRRRTDCCGMGWTVRCASPVMSSLRPLMKFKCLYVFLPIKQLISLPGYLNDTETDPRVMMLIHKLRIMHLSFENCVRKKRCARVAGRCVTATTLLLLQPIHWFRLPSNPRLAWEELLASEVISVLFQQNMLHATDNKARSQAEHDHVKKKKDQLIILIFSFYKHFPTRVAFSKRFYQHVWKCNG